jgi:hypothetical protein
MKLYSYRGSSANFGDELNDVLLTQVFPDFFDDDESELFLGIGSVLFNHHPREARKIVFGSGYAGYTPPPTVDSKWKFYCVRGPRTAQALGLEAALVAADSAILISDFVEPPKQKSHPVSYIPHWQSLGRSDWAGVCRLAGINFIDPRRPVMEVLEAIAASGVVVAEAMHGAIVADALRVPWIPVLPFHPSHRYKWHDWAEALDIDLKHRRLLPASVLEAWISLTGRNGQALLRSGGRTRSLMNVGDTALQHAAARSLRRISASAPMLSEQTAFNRALEKLQVCVQRIKRDYSGRSLSYKQQPR